MLSFKENHSVTEFHEDFDLAVVSVLGNRKRQEDSFGYFLDRRGGLITVCDGMGGHAGGRFASQTAAAAIVSAYEQCDTDEDICKFLADIVPDINERVFSLKDDSGERMNAGSTMVTIAIENKELFWISVGDSRIYLRRGDEFIQITTDHVYRLMLDECLAAGEIDSEKYRTEFAKKDALISYLGMESLDLIDRNVVPFKLQSGDQILLASDGLYKLLSDEEIGSILSNFSNINEALQVLELKVEKIAKSKKISRDNMTAALIRIR